MLKLGQVGHYVELSSLGLTMLLLCSVTLPTRKPSWQTRGSRAAFLVSSSHGCCREGVWIEWSQGQALTSLPMHRWGARPSMHLWWMLILQALQRSPCLAFVPVRHIALVRKQPALCWWLVWNLWESDYFHKPGNSFLWLLHEPFRKGKLLW